MERFSTKKGTLPLWIGQESFPLPANVYSLEKFAQSERNYYDVILMDLRMPNMNGFESTEAIRKLHRSDAMSIPIIAMSADAFSEDVQNCLAAGMNGHVAKPINVEQLLGTVTKFLSVAQSGEVGK